ncbi:hypothetical protein BEN47_06780 [Hymenobacter lapidarius]|uniref:Uncharacterized protein n=1 Tax=Hymenobacter lapidarius TaxID=1908237 RepID=A0A1G1TFD1_9BACT|nr:hypothetical protein [Hymenobacter lapidarius]OGX89582.1 hypothetical protein BEN47_06780 [Hymenobacter lapidarius]
MEDYAAKMLLKTDAALREYVTGHVQYREAAVLAAFDELRRRGQPAPEEATLRPGLEVAATTQRRVEEAAEAEQQQAALAADPEAAAAAGPALYSPAAIVLFSMFSVVIGGVLMSLNLYRVGRKQAIWGLIIFSIAYAYLGSLAVAWATTIGLSPIWGVLIFNLSAALAYVLWFWPRYLGTVPFRSRSVLIPVLICMVVLWGIQKLTPYLMENKAVREQMKDIMPK